MHDLRSRNLIGVGECKGGLYRMNSVAPRNKAMMAKLDAEVWHKRLRHSSELKLREISFLSSFSHVLKGEFFDSCVKAKHTRLPFPDKINHIATYSKIPIFA